MKTAMNINKLLKLLMIILSVVFMATACSPNNDTNSMGTMGDSTESDAETYSAEQRQCWQTGVVDLLYNEMGKVAMGSYSKLTGGALAMMMIAFAVWLSFRLIKHVSSFTEENMAEVWTEILKKLFICIVCGLLASSTENLLFVMNSIIFPLYNAFLEFGSEILAKSTNGGKAGQISLFGETWSLGQPVVCTVTDMQPANLVNFPEAPKQMMDCMICAVNERLNLGYAASFKVMAAPGIMPVFIGLCILACFTFVKLGFVFYLVDTIFKMTIMMIMLPLLIMAYAFDQTKKWATFGFYTILNSAAFMMFIAIMMTMALLAMEQVIKDNSAFFDEGQDYQSFKEFSVPFMCLIMIAFLLIYSIGIAQDVSGSLVGGSTDAKFQRKLKAVVQKATDFLLSKIPVINIFHFGAKKLQEEDKDEDKDDKNSVSGKLQQGAQGAMDKYNKITNASDTLDKSSPADAAPKSSTEKMAEKSSEVRSASPGGQP